METQRKTGKPNKNLRPNRTRTEGSSLTRNNNSRTPKKRVRLKLNKSNSGSTIDPAASAFYCSRRKLPNYGMYHVAPDWHMSHHDRNQVEHSSTCVIALRHSQSEVIDEDSGKLAYVGQWSAGLWDAACMSHCDLHSPFSFSGTTGSSLSTRDLVIRSHQINARRHGFSHCEVRVYVGTSDNYLPLFGGPLPELTAIS